MANAKYEVIIYWSKEDDAYVAEVHRLAGCAAHGDSQEESLRNGKRRLTCGSKPLRNLVTQFRNRRAVGWCSPEVLAFRGMDRCGVSTKRRFVRLGSKYGRQTPLLGQVR